MSLLCLKLLLKKDVKDRIMLKINEIQHYLDWNDFNISINVSDLDLLNTNYDDVIKQQKISEFLAKLSIDLWRDFDYYRQFSIDDRDKSEYVDGLVNLGYVCVDGKWKCVYRPNEDNVQANVFQYCLYRLIADEMIRKKSISCPFCDADIFGTDDKCDVCGAFMDEINQHREAIIDIKKMELLFKNDDEIITDNVTRSNYVAEGNGNDVVTGDEYVSCVGVVTFEEDRNEIIQDSNDNEERRVIDEVGLDRGTSDEGSNCAIPNNDDNERCMNTVQRIKEEEFEELKYTVNKKERNTVNEPQANDGWICSSCSFNNESNNEQCDVCLMRRDCGVKEMRNIKLEEEIEEKKEEIVYRDKSVRENTWVCPCCTFVNTIEDVRCNVCYVDRFGLDEEQNKVKRVNPISYDSKKLPRVTISAKQRRSDVDRFKSAPLLLNVSKKKAEKLAYNPRIESRNPIITSMKEIPMKIWVCPSCTFKNKSTETRCGVCFTAAKEQLGDVNATIGTEDVASVTTKKWQCTKCEGANPRDRRYCRYCHEYAVNLDKWVCEQCSYLNDPLAPCCAVCSVINLHLKKCDKCRTNGAMCSACTDESSQGTVNQEGGAMSPESSSADQERRRERPSVKHKKYRRSEIFYCNNRRCGAANSITELHCSKCCMKKGCNVTAYNQVEVFAGGKYVMMWQCTYCGGFNGVDGKCTECTNNRCAQNDKVCVCNWANNAGAVQCEKCAAFF